MTPFQQFRLWLRRAPVGERAVAAVAAAMVLLLVLVLLPSSAGSEASETLAGGGDPAVTEEVAAVGPGGTAAGDGTRVQAPGSVAPADATGAGSTSVSTGAADSATGGVPQTGTGPSSTAAAAGGTTATGPAAGPAKASRSCPQGKAPGVTEKKMKIAVIMTKIVGPAANALFGVATPEQQREYWKRVLDDVNANGGAGCRELVPTFYEANPADNTNLQEVCLDIVGSGAFAALDTQAYAQFPVVECYPRNKVPYFGGYFASETIRARSFPYLFQFNSMDQAHKDAVFALRDRGFFQKENGFTRLAFPHKSCDSQLIKKMRSWLGQAGVRPSQIVEFDFGCANGLASPSTIQQAILTFQREGATSLTYANLVGDFGNFTRIAEQQGYRPRYGLPNDALISVSKGSVRQDPDNIANAIAIDQGRYAEETTPGTKPTAATARCSAIMKEDVYDLPNIAGKTCNMAWIFMAAVDNAPQLARTALAAGLQRAGSVEFSYPQGPNTFAAPRTTTGGQFWRPTRFTRSCACWRVTDAAFKPSYR